MHKIKAHDPWTVVTHKYRISSVNDAKLKVRHISVDMFLLLSSEFTDTTSQRITHKLFNTAPPSGSTDWNWLDREDDAASMFEEFLREASTRLDLDTYKALDYQLFAAYVRRIKKNLQQQKRRAATRRLHELGFRPVSSSPGNHNSSEGFFRLQTPPPLPPTRPRRRRATPMPVNVGDDVPLTSLPTPPPSSPPTTSSSSLTALPSHITRRPKRNAATQARQRIEAARRLLTTATPEVFAREFTPVDAVASIENQPQPQTPNPVRSRRPTTTSTREGSGLGREVQVVIPTMTPEQEREYHRFPNLDTLLMAEQSLGRPGQGGLLGDARNSLLAKALRTIADAVEGVGAGDERGPAVKEEVDVEGLLGV